MRIGLVAHVMLLAGNIGWFLGMSSGHGVMGGGGVEPTALEAMRKEQARQQSELARLSSAMDVSKAHFPQQAGGGHCKESGEDAPGVTVYLETASAEDLPRTDAAGTRQWTAVSFKDVGPSPDGSRQAVMSIHKADVKSGAGGFMPVQAAPRWQ